MNETEKRRYMFGSSDLSGVTKSETLGAGQECPAYRRFS